MKTVRVILALMTISLLASAPVSAEGAGIGIKPANPDPTNKRTESIFVYTKDAGESFSDVVQLINNSGSAKKVRLYAVDATVSTGGAFACAQAAEKKLDAGSWIKLGSEQYELMAQSAKTVTFKITIPKQTSPGEHGGCLVIEEIGAPATDSGNGISLSFRSAVRVSITVRGDIRKAVSFVSTTNRQEANRILSQTALRNSGNVSTDVSVSVELKSLLGSIVAQNGGQYPLLAQTTAEWNYELNKPFWGGIYQVQTTAKYNNDPNAPIGKAELDTTLHSRRQFVLLRPQPFALVLEILAFVVVSFTVLLAVLRRRSTTKLSNHSKSYTVKSGETINDIADAYNTSWKQLARMNKLKAPYVVKKGQKIRVPKARDA